MGKFWATLKADEWTLGDVGFHWGGAYIVLRSLDSYRAMRRDRTGETPIAADPAELVTLIRADYGASPIAR